MSPLRRSRLPVALFALGAILALAIPSAATSGRARPALTGTHWAEPSDMPNLKANGYGFDVQTCQPSDLSSCAAKLDAAQANGLKLIIGGYPEPYTLANGVWTITPAGVSMLNLFASRASDVLGVFVFNEPYYTAGYSADDLRALRAKIQSVWPGAKIYHDLGQPSGWAPGGPYSGGSSKWADQTNVCDLCGVWDYPFETGGYQKARSLATLQRETSFVTNSIHGVSVWLNQSHAASCCNLVFPTQAQLLDWNCATRAALPAGSLISWYVWRQAIYSDTLSAHPEDWASTTAASCRRRAT